jgi:AraC-like DNA-binding protein
LKREAKRSGSFICRLQFPWFASAIRAAPSLAKPEFGRDGRTGHATRLRIERVPRARFGCQDSGRGVNQQSIEANPHASSLSIKARHLIAKTYTDDPSIARVAARLSVTNAHLSRQFRRDYALSPREYLHQLRIADATLQLAKGESIADVSGNSGYGDLSRFYKQFRKNTRMPPGACREIVAPRRT